MVGHSWAGNTPKFLLHHLCQVAAIGAKIAPSRLQGKLGTAAGPERAEGKGGAAGVGKGGSKLQFTGFGKREREGENSAGGSQKEAVR
jgi:hypothetical protein